MSMDLDTAVVSCPYCGEPVEIAVDPTNLGEMVHDCEVCCRPWSLRVERDRHDPDGAVRVTARRLD